MRSWTGACASVLGAGLSPGVCIGSTVILVVLRCCNIRRFAMLSAVVVLMVVLLELLLVCWRVLRQAVTTGRRMAIRRVMEIFVFFIVVFIYYKSNTFGRSVQ